MIFLMHANNRIDCRKRLANAVFMVGVKGFEPPTSCSQSRRATNCATPRNFYEIVLFVVIVVVKRSFAELELLKKSTV